MREGMVLSENSIFLYFWKDLKDVFEVGFDLFNRQSRKYTRLFIESVEGRYEEPFLKGVTFGYNKLLTLLALISRCAMPFSSVISWFLLLRPSVAEFTIRKNSFISMFLFPTISVRDDLQVATDSLS